jgi:hypothetical protein
MRITPRTTHFLLRKNFKKNMTLTLLSVLHCLSWKQGQVARRDNMMEQRKKAKEKFQF